MIQNLVNYLYPCDNNRKLLKIDLEKNFDSISFNSHFPHKQNEIDNIFKKTITDTDDVISVSEILQSPELRNNYLNILKSLNFNQLANHPKSGIILEHPEFPGWLIKKNFRIQRDEIGKPQQILKVVRGSNFPSWMLPEHLKNSTSVNITVPNDCINPLRVVMLKRGREIIKALELTHIRAAKEYLYLIPDTDSSQPLYERTVVISKKENVLSSKKSLSRYVKLAQSSPAKLTEIAKQIVLFIKHVQLTDSHLNNFLFLDDDTDVVVAVDGEPIGGLADVSIPGMVAAVQEFDPSFWSILGLKKLQVSITEQMKNEDIAQEDIARVQAIFDKEINSTIPDIIRERQWQLIRSQAHESLLVFNVTSYLLQSVLQSAVNAIHCH